MGCVTLKRRLDKAVMYVNSWLAGDVIILENLKLKNQQSCYPHQVLEVVNLYLLTTFQLSSLLRLETSAFQNYGSA